MEYKKEIKFNTGEFVKLVVLMFYSIFSYSYVMSKLYDWFLVAHFGLTYLPFTTFVGVYLFTLFVKSNGLKIKDEYKDKRRDLSLKIMSPWLTLGVIYTCHIICAALGN